MFFKTDADRASTQAARARHDAGEAGSSAASGARNLGAAVLATLAEVTAPSDDHKGKKHAQKARARAVKAARKDREAASRAASKAATHGRKAAEHSRAAADRRAGEAGGTLAALADAAGHKAAGAAATAGQKAAGAAATAGQKATGAAVTAAGTAKVAGSQLAHKVTSSELADKARTQATHVREVATERSAPLADSAKEKAGASAALIAALAAAAREKADETRTRALLGMDHGIDAAVPRAQEGVAAVGPKVDHLRDVINNELLPKLQEMIGDVQANKDRLLTKEEGVVAAVTGTPKKRKRKGGALIALGLLAAAGAGVAWYLNQQQRQGATDPWASQAGAPDPWASRTPTTAADTTTATTTVTPTTPAPTTPAAAPVGASATGEAPRMLESEEIDALASDTPSTAEEQTPGESPTQEIETARGGTGSAPVAADVSAGEVDEGHDPGEPRV